MSYFYIIKITQFLSTLSLRRATIPDREPAAGYLISIHALLAESDPTRWAPTCRISNFYPRSPCGERPPLPTAKSSILFYFYPRSPCGERPIRPAALWCSECISIHALLAESDTCGCILSTPMLNFYPRSPCGERQVVHKMDIKAR